MKNLQIDDEVWECLKDKAKALGTTPNAVLRKMLGLDKGPIEETPRKAYRRPILKALQELGGSGKAIDILDRLETMMIGILNEKDKALLSNGEPRWRKSANWVRFELVREGLLKKNSPRGIWEISEKGSGKLKSIL